MEGEGSSEVGGVSDSVSESLEEDSSKREGVSDGEGTLEVVGEVTMSGDELESASGERLFSLEDRVDGSSLPNVGAESVA